MQKRYLMSSVREGAKAPKFRLCDKDGKEHGVGVTKANYTVLYFYPKDDTPGCTIEAQEFSAALKDFTRRGAQVIGISGGDQKTKEKFCSKFKLSVRLVSDSDFEVSRSYGVYGDKKFMGRTYKGIHRTTFVIDESGKVAKVFGSVKPEGHAQEVLSALDELSGKTKPTKRATAKPASKVKAKKASAPQKAKSKPATKASRRSK